MIINNVFLNRYDITYYLDDNYCVSSLYAPNGAFARRLILKKYPDAQLVDCHLTGSYKEEPANVGEK